MLGTILSSSTLSDIYQLSFSYRHTFRYLDGFLQRVGVVSEIYPLNFIDVLDASLLSRKVPTIFRRIYFFLQRLLLIYPLFIYEVYVIYKLLKKIRPSIVQVNNGGFPGALSARAATCAAKMAGVNTVIMFVHNMAVDYKLFFRKFEYPLDLWVKKSTDLFLCGSTVASKRLEKVLCLDAEHAKALPHGIEICLPRRDRATVLSELGLEGFEGLILGVVGVLGERKGHKVLLEALSILAVKSVNNHNYRVLIVGGGEMLDELRYLAEELGIADRCLFLGNQTYVGDFMNVMDILLLPSIENEDFPFVVLEAMSLGKPIIASKVAGTIEQVVDLETGILVEPKNARELAEAIRTLSDDEALRNKMGIAGKARYLKNFTVDAAIKNYVSIYKSSLTSRN